MKLRNKIGGVICSAREYDIATSTEIKPGQIVKLSGGLVVKAAAGETGKLLGVAAEYHSGSTDVFNPRANGKKILVYDDPMAIYECNVPVHEATGGSATTVTMDDLGAFSNDDFNGGYLKLVEKAASSTNTDKLGIIKQITDYGYNATGTVSTFTVATGGAANDGDKYEVYPPVTFAKGNYDTNIMELVLTTAASLTMKVVGHDLERGKLLLQMNTAVLGVED